MINTDQLTQEQKWGLEFAVLKANEAIQSANEALAEGQEPKPLYTESSYAEFVFRGACDSYYAQLLESKKQSALSMFDALTPEQQAALVAQLGIPDVLPQG